MTLCGGGVSISRKVIIMTVEYRIKPPDVWECPLCTKRVSGALYHHLDSRGLCRCSQVRLIEYEPIILFGKIERGYLPERDESDDRHSL